MNKSGTGGFPEKESAFLLHAGESGKQTAIIAFYIGGRMWENDKPKKKMEERKRQIQKESPYRRF